MIMKRSRVAAPWAAAPNVCVRVGRAILPATLPTTNQFVLHSLEMRVR